MAKYGFIRELNVEKVELTLALMVKKYNFADLDFKVLDKELKDSLINLIFL